MRLKVMFLVFLSVFLASSVFAEDENVDLYDVNKSSLDLLTSTVDFGTYSDVTYDNGFFDRYAHLIETNNMPLVYSDNNLLNGINSINHSDWKKKLNYIINLNKSVDVNGVFLKMSNAIGSSVNFYDEQNNLLGAVIHDQKKYDINGLYYSKSFKNVKKIELVRLPITYFYEFDFFIDPASLYSSVIDILDVVTHNTATFRWKNPSDILFTGNKVYLDDVLLTKSQNKIVTYNLKDLEPDTEYKLTVSALYSDVEVFKHYYFRTAVDPGDITPPLDSTSFDLLPFLNAVELSFKPSLSDDVSHYKLYRNGVLIKDKLTDLKYLDENLDEYTSYVYKLTVVDKSGNESKGVSKTVKTLTSADLVPPDEVKNLKVEEDYTVTSRSIVEQLNAKITFDFPDDDDFSHVVLVRDGSVLNDNLTSNNFLDVRLDEMTSYSYKLHTVDLNGNRSPGVIVNFKTSFIPDSIPPVPPINLVIQNGNGSGKVSWLKNSESDLDGYHVYLDGVKVTNKPIKNDYFSFKGLDNGTTYDVQVTAVDWSGNESVKSETVTLIPDLSAPTIVDLNDAYDLKDVAVFTSGLFGDLWWIVNFVVGLILAFLIGRRVKDLFVGS